MIFRLNEPFVIPAFLYSTNWTLDALTWLSDLLFILLNANKSQWFVMFLTDQSKFQLEKLKKNCQPKKKHFIKNYNWSELKCDFWYLTQEIVGGCHGQGQVVRSHPGGRSRHGPDPQAGQKQQGDHLLKGKSKIVSNFVTIVGRDITLKVKFVKDSFEYKLKRYYWKKNSPLCNSEKNRSQTS